MILADSALVFVEGHVQAPVLAVLDGPVVSDQLGNLLAALPINASPYGDSPVPTTRLTGRIRAPWQYATVMAKANFLDRDSYQPIP